MPYRLLLVDDSPAMRAFIRRTLEVSGMEVAECLEAADGVEAIEHLKAAEVDVVLTDINMPRMDGEELVCRMEADASLRQIPVVVVSTDSTEVRMKRLLQLGAKGYVSKPFRPETLRGELERVLGAT
jgi:two-component system, chemotaxis family, chemotaxis protein CheY